MELFNLLAKLTLDKTEYEKSIQEAEQQAGSIDIDEPSLGLDTSDFEDAIEEAEDTDIEDPDSPELGLDKGEFDDVVEEAEDTDVADPDSPELGLDNQEYVDSLDEAEGESETFSESVQSIFTNLKTVLAGLGIAAVVTGVVNTLKEGVELAKNHGDQIDKQSQKMKISAKAYQEYSYALGLSGASIDDLNRGLRTWQQSVGDEKKTEELGEAFKALGLDAEKALDQIANGENLDGLLDSVMYALADYSGGDRGALAEALFGKGATGLNAFFNQTSKDIKDVKEEANDLGLIMSDDEVKNAAAYMDATTRLEGALNGIKEAFAGEILPYLTEATNKLAEFIGSLNPRSKENSLAEVLDDLDTKALNASRDMDAAASTAQAMIDKLSGMGDYWTLDEKDQKTWDALAKEFVETYPQFADAIDQENHAIRGNTDEIKENIRQWTLREKQRLIDENTAKKREAVAQKYADALDKEVEAEVKEAEASGKRAEAIAEINEALEKAGMQTLGADATTSEMRQAKVSLQQRAGDNMEEILKIDALGSSYIETMAEAKKLRTESESMYEEADAAQASLEAYNEKLAEKMGITIDNTEKANTAASNYAKTLRNVPTDVTTTFHQAFDSEGEPKAIGDNYIPYDNFPALLHRGERVLTATENRRGVGGEINYTELENRIVASIRQGMQGATVNSYINGKKVTDEVNRQNINAVKGRRFAR